MICEESWFLSQSKNKKLPFFSGPPLCLIAAITFPAIASPGSSVVIPLRGLGSVGLLEAGRTTFSLKVLYLETYVQSMPDAQQSRLLPPVKPFLLFLDFDLLSPPSP